MRRKKIIFDGQVWGVEVGAMSTVASLIEDAMENGKVAALTLLTEDDCPVKVLFNGARVTSAVIDDGALPRPTEISG